MKRELIIGVGGLAVIAAVIVIGGERRTPAPAANAPAVVAASDPAARPAPRARRVSPGVTLRGPAAGGASGALALRAQADDYLEQQGAAVDEHMRREGLTRDETRELTYFGVLAVQSQDWGAVEAQTGQALSAEARRETWEAMMARSQEMRRELQEQIAAGAGEDARWETIARIEDGYLDDYYRITGMTPAMLDALLAAAVRDQRSDATIASLAPDAEPPGTGGKPGQWVRRDPANPSAPPVPVTEQPAP